ncbi:ribosome recycling factor [Auritidibacter ignavus]|nr:MULTISPECIES: ribosome recycling factor [Auritidibacter]AXR73835.1 ribosome recycling factor [Auritidibacter sp. NML130574]NIH72265.1 ribosome recycling factor [Auritidibacter ignavus]PXA78980.1 ribosome recycling factor [Auritidibacter sp. NML120636]RMX23727.1 ribosome recycling factor [Auritidibacter ignavus]WGH82485.1 ribosome recycling factor [Auritidibacter ignavus]
MTSEVLNDAKAAMERTLEATSEDFASVRTGRATPGLFAKVLVDYYGTPTPLQQLASFTAQDARTLLIAPYDVSALREIEKALSDSEVGANPSNDGKVIRIVMPELTAERRAEYVKLVKSKAEDHKVSIRNSRRKAKETLEKMVNDGEIGEDEGKRGEKELDDLTRKYVDQVEEMAKNKEQDLMEV